MATANPAIGAADQSPAASRENFKGEVLDPSVFNKNYVRLGAVALVVGLAARGTGYLPARWAVFTHLLSFSINLGMIFWVSAIALPRLTVMKRMFFGIPFCVDCSRGIVADLRLQLGVVSARRSSAILTEFCAVSSDLIHVWPLVAILGNSRLEKMRH